MEGGTDPWAVRSEFTAEARWGSISPDLRRYEIRAPRLAGPLRDAPEAIGCVHGGRSSLMVRISGASGHLKAPREVLVERLLAAAVTHLTNGGSGPADHVHQVVSWLEGEQRSGLLEHSYTTATLLVAVSDAEAWGWHVCPHGLAKASPAGVRFESTDLRYPVLRRLGLMRERAFRTEGLDVADAVESVWCIGTPNGYERIRTAIEPGGAAIAMDRGCLPYGPWPTAPIPIATLWTMDAAWKHGLAGLAVVVGHVSLEDLALPEDWSVRVCPFSP